MYKMRCTAGHFVPPLERANLPPDSKWRQFASTLPYVVGPLLEILIFVFNFFSKWGFLITNFALLDKTFSTIEKRLSDSCPTAEHLWRGQLRPFCPSPSATTLPAVAAVAAVAVYSTQTFIGFSSSSFSERVTDCCHYARVVITYVQVTSAPCSWTNPTGSAPSLPSRTRESGTSDNPRNHAYYDSRSYGRSLRRTKKIWNDSCSRKKP